MFDFICAVIEKIKDVFNILLKDIYEFETSRSTRSASSDYIYDHEMSNFS